GEQNSEILPHHDRHGGLTTAGGKPIGPPDHETWILAEGIAGKRVVSTGIGEHRAQFGDVGGGEKSAKRADNPYSEEQFAIGKLGSNVAMSAEHPDADRITDDHGNAESEAKGLQQAGAAALRTPHFHR